MTKPRYDGRGHPWANQHRLMPDWHYMSDVDGIFGIVMWKSHSAERIFFEYVPDPYGNRYSSRRRFGVLAIFDMKRQTYEQVDAAIRAGDVEPRFYAHLAAVLSQSQPVPVRYFIVTGSEIDGWILHELHTETLVKIGETFMPADGTVWQVIWDQIGLSPARRILHQWLDVPA